MTTARAPAVLLAGTLLVAACGSRGPEPGFVTLDCCGRLRLVMGLLDDMRDNRCLRPLAGREFILQTAGGIPEEYEEVDLRVFCCRGDPLAPRLNIRSRLYCSFFGPDAETAERFVRRDLPEPVILICDGFGEDGATTAHSHRNTVLVLWNDRRVEEIRVERIAGCGTPGFRIGPGCPDARFAHLRR
jgi:hypothetical protein